MHDNREKNMKRIAIKHMTEGLNCAESVFMAFLETSKNSDESELVAIASGFGGGIDSSRANTCGALIGACLAVSHEKGRKNPYNKETRKERRVELVKEIKPVFQNISTGFREKFGTTICSDMCVGFEDPKKRQANCNKAVLVACSLVIDALKK